MSKSKAIIFDIDGTVAIRDTSPDGRGPFDLDRVGEDLPNAPVLAVARLLGNTKEVTIVFVSGREEVCHHQTTLWLQHHYGMDFYLFMRRRKDNRPDHEVKKEILDYIRHIWDVFVVFDDRNQTVDMWRDNGITCMQVCSREDGDF